MSTHITDLCSDTVNSREKSYWESNNTTRTVQYQQLMITTGVRRESKIHAIYLDKALLQCKQSLGQSIDIEITRALNDTGEVTNMTSRHAVCMEIEVK